MRYMFISRSGQLERQHNPKLPLYVVLYCIAIFLKQFYILPSGSLQICDLFFCLAFLSCLFLQGISLYKRDLPLAVFVAFACLINIFYFALTDFSHIDFLESSLFLFYNLMIVFLFRSSFDNPNSLLAIGKTFKICIILQLAIFFLGVGRWYSSNRYEGTFNNPNQYGFFLITIMYMNFNIDYAFQNRLKYLWVGLAAFLVVLSFSLANTLCVIVLIGFILLMKMYERLSKSVFIGLFVCGAVLVCSVVGGVIMNGQTLIRLFDSSSIAYEALDTINQYSASFLETWGADRNMEALINFPVGLIIGIGGGYPERFGGQGELHSAIFQLLFYYGLIPYSLLVLWVWKNLKRTKYYLVPSFIGLMVYSLFGVAYRQPTFWMLIAMQSFSCFRLYGRVEKMGGQSP